MAKARRELADRMSSVDVVLEVLDARMPLSSRNPLVGELRGDKPFIEVLSKSDLADPVVTKAWLAALTVEKAKVAAIACSAERIRDLNEDARAIAGLGIGGRGPAVLEVLEDRERLDDHVVARAALHPRDEAHAARVVLHRRAIEAMRLGLTAQLRERPHPRVIEHLVLHRDLFEVRPL